MNKERRSSSLTEQINKKADFVWEGISLNKPDDLDKLANYDQPFNLHIIPQTHIDLAWMWTREDSHKMILSTFQYIVEQLENNAEYTFAQSQLYAYQVVETHDAELFSRIKNLIRRGKWEVVGGQWVEPDHSIPSGESHIRQLLRGQRYAKEKLGVKSNVAWCPDSFTEQPNSLVDIFLQAGLNYLVFKRPREIFSKLPLTPFLWGSPSGNQMIALRANNKGKGWPTLSQGQDGGLARVGKEYNELGIYGLWAPLGCGDCGGRLTYFKPGKGNGCQQVYNVPTRFFEMISEAQQKKIAKIDGNLGIEMSGCLTTHAELKRLNRTAENILQQAEFAASILKISGGDIDLVLKNIKAAWDYVLFNQFHDIITGVGYREITDQAQHDYKTAISMASEARHICSYNIAKSVGIQQPESCEILVFNSLGWNRSEYVVGEVDLKLRPNEAEQKQFVAVDDEGVQSKTDVKLCKDVQGKWFRWRITFFAQNLKPFSFKRYRIIAQNNCQSVAKVKRKGLRFDTGGLTVEFDPEDGTLKKIAKARSGLSILGPLAKWKIYQEGKYVLDYGIEHRAWYLGLSGKKYDTKLKELECWHFEHGYKVKTVHKFKHSSFEQIFSIYEGRDFIDVDVLIDWHEVEMLSRLEFNTGSLGPKAKYFRDAPYQLSILPNDGNEYPMQKFCAAEGNAVLHIANNGRYGCSSTGKELRFSCIRCSTYPDLISDEGKYEFKYRISILPVSEDHNQMIASAEGFNIQPWLAQIESGIYQESEMRAAPPFRFENQRILPLVLKPSESDDGLHVMRLFNVADTQQELTISVEGFKLSPINILEEVNCAKFEKCAKAQLKPFELVSFILRK